ncbi:hypothetical protein [Methanoculleus oceani]|uniref:hypothetical protein n=1 Tax=Methanoculleus oceani TaxID=2184756 RepID=UPI0020346C15|nr:hypothetical protein [Methanoculleus sp. CWC-02]
MVDGEMSSGIRELIVEEITRAVLERLPAEGLERLAGEFELFEYNCTGSGFTCGQRYVCNAKGHSCKGVFDCMQSFVWRK